MGLTGVLIVLASLTWLSTFIIPEVRVWLHLEKPVAPPPAVSTSKPTNPVIPPSRPAAEPNPEPTPKKVIQHSGTKVKGNQNVAGNNVAGNQNIVGNGNQVTTPAPLTVGPGSIVVNGGIVNNPTVNNLGLPDPRISFVIVEGPALENVKNPHVCVKITIDRMMENPQFGVLCDRACKSVFGDVIFPPSGGGKQTSWGAIRERPDVAAFVVNFPNPMPSDYGYLACVESEDESPVHILGVRKIIPTP